LFAFLGKSPIVRVDFIEKYCDMANKRYTVWEGKES